MITPTTDTTQEHTMTSLTSAEYAARIHALATAETTITSEDSYPYPTTWYVSAENYRVRITESEHDWTEVYEVSVSKVNGDVEWETDAAEHVETLTEDAAARAAAWLDRWQLGTGREA